MAINILYLREAYLGQLKSNISGNIELYKEDVPWLEYYFGNSDYILPSKLYMSDIELIKPIGSDNYDLENTKILYKALKDLKVSQASDERLWVYLTHNIFWDYMRKRWPIENMLGKKNPENILRERYFFMSNRSRALVRNGIARLWWYGYVSYDDSRKDPFELTEMLLKRQDDAQNLLERRFSRNPMIIKAILSAIGDESINREKYRELMKYLNWLGGVTILDALSSEDIKELVNKKLR